MSAAWNHPPVVPDLGALSDLWTVAANGQRQASTSLELNSQRIAYGLRVVGRNSADPALLVAAADLTAWTLATSSALALPSVAACAILAPAAHDAAWAAPLWTARWLLHWHTDLLHDPAIPGLLIQLGEQLLVRAATSAASAAASALFLAELAQLSGQPRYTHALNAALAQFAPWSDHDPASIFWSGLALLKAYRLTGDPDQRRTGYALADQLAAYETGSKLLALPPAASAELYAAAYRLSHAPHHPQQARSTLQRAISTAPKTGPADLQALATWAILTVNYPDVLAFDLTPIN